MTLISTKEFNTNQDKYFDLAQDEAVCIKRGANIFYLVCKQAEPKKEIICEPDDDFRNSITWDDFRTRTRKMMQKYLV